MRRVGFAGAIFAVMALALLVTPRAASAAPILIINQDHILLGADNVDVNGQAYNVRFLDSSCVVVFDGCDAASDFNFTTVTDAAAAAVALVAQVFVDVQAPFELFDTYPFLTAGCGTDQTDPPYCAVVIPFTFSNFDPSTGIVVGTLAVNPAGSSNNSVTVLDLPVTLDLGTDEHAVYAQFTPVPEPTSLFLLGTGVVGLGARLRRRRQQAL